MSFLNVVEIESALAGLANTYPTIATLVPLPSATAEGRQSHAVVIGTGRHCPDVKVFILSGAHAREWGGPDICVNFAADLCKAYSNGAGLSYGGKSFTAAEIASIVNRVQVIVFPDLNPDGRHFSQTSYAMWRKNRNPASSTPGQFWTTGVDPNRNFDFLWDLSAFAPAAQSSGTLGSSNPGSDTFHGTGPFSEPETKNVAWLFKKYGPISRFVDIHSFGGDVLHPWGDDENQTADPAKSFTNAAWHGQRGVAGDAYGEYVVPADLATLTVIGASMRSAIAAVRGETYSLAQAFFLPSVGGTYPTSGTSDDWAFSLRYSGTSRTTTWAFAIEFNRDRASGFFPTWGEMQKIIRDMSAGLVQFCLDAVPARRWPWIVCLLGRWWLTFWRRLFPWELWGPYGPWNRPRGPMPGPG